MKGLKYFGIHIGHWLANRKPKVLDGGLGFRDIIPNNGE